MSIVGLSYLSVFTGPMNQINASRCNTVKKEDLLFYLGKRKRPKFGSLKMRDEYRETFIPVSFHRHMHQINASRCNTVKKEDLLFYLGKRKRPKFRSLDEVEATRD
ncbi:hypothetical protein CDAR_97561 [Caerostris darwini]|uniref:Uncharacterized protein n=1 Tax=Caerostris darwini TaxID=1538125 RepID=A0AAV4SKY7_9ARAC|nr:hypothetical protein CDAR_97561 [Caerostris darwini]